jgi:hypothetical protein
MGAAVTIVVVDDGESVTLTGRVAAMVRWLVSQAERLNTLPQVRVEFNCSGFKSVKPKIEECQREVMV